MGRLIKLEQYVKDAIEECPQAKKDDIMLIGLVYERYLGEKKAEIYGLRWCMENYEKIKLPPPESVTAVKKRVIEKYI